MSELLPHFIEGERAILGAVLVDNDVLPQVLTTLSPADMYNSGHRAILEAMIALSRNNRKIDFVSLPEALKGAGKLEAVGGHPYILDLIDAVPSAANVGHYVEQVRAKSLRRKLIQSCTEAIAQGRSDEELSKILADLQQDCLSLLVNTERRGPRRFSEINREAFSALDQQVTTGTTPGLPTGFTGLDIMTGGMQPGELWIVCARPSVGKTALSTNIAMNLAQAGGFVIAFSLEMSNRDNWGRIIARQSKIPFHLIRKALLSRNDMSRLMTALGDLDEIPLWIDDTPAIKPSDILMRSQKLAMEQKRSPDLIMIDYLQIMHPNKESKSRERDVASMAADSKALAKQLNCPVILNCQLNREVTKRKDQRPQLQDLRESGAIEQDADVVIGIFRKWPIEQKEEFKTHAELGILKQRNGPIGWDACVSWNPHTVSFQDGTGQQQGPVNNPRSYQEPREPEMDHF